jgi:DNA invertase Pin-like site-specific DNA recombinase
MDVIVLGTKVLGYVRVSTSDQNPDRQIDLLMQEHGIKESDIFIDKISGVKYQRPALDELQKVLREGDTVVVESLSRVSRSTADLLNILGDWQDRGIIFISHKERLSFYSTAGKLILTLLGAISTFERDTLRDRVAEGLASARARGRIGGRPRTDRKAVVKDVKLYEAKTHSLSEVCSITGVSRSVLYREFKRLRDVANELT